jgi:ferric-dicitrate binding protein FerR (iron transport regulator)
MKRNSGKERKSGKEKTNDGFRYTPEERRQYMKKLSAIYYKCLMGKAGKQEFDIAEKFSPPLIERLKNEYPMEEMTPSEAEKEKEEKEMNEMWKLVSERLNMNRPLPASKERPFVEADYREAYEVELKTRKRKAVVRRLYRHTAMAAMIACVLGIGYLLNNGTDGWNDEPQQTEYTAVSSSTGHYRIRKGQLADGTRIELNRESALEISETFGKKKREVSMKGQVFFDVAKDPDKPFVINAQGINVTVRGTSFEVVAYDEIPEKEVTVCTGRVEVNDARSGKRITTLTKGMQLIFNPETHTAEVKTVNTELITAWREGNLILHNASLPELKLRVRQHFGKTLVVERHALKEDIRITSTFNTEEATVENMMLRLHALFGVQSRIEGDRIIISPGASDATGNKQ